MIEEIKREMGLIKQRYQNEAEYRFFYRTVVIATIILGAITIWLNSIF